MAAAAFGQPSSGLGPGNIVPYGPSANNGSGLDLNFFNGADPRVTLTRAAGGATYFDATNTLQMATVNAQRIDYGTVPSGVTNWIRNSAMVGVAAGTPGTLPTNWSVTAAAGLTTNVIGSGTESGIPYVDIQLTGTSSGTQLDLVFDLATVIPANQSQVWTISTYVRLVGGTLANISTAQNVTAETTSGGVFVQNDFGVGYVPTGAALTSQRNSTTFTVAQATTANLRPGIAVNVTTASAINATFRIGAPQLELGAVANPWVPTSGTIANVGAVPLGLLIEEARTNSIRNPRCEGAVAASPGTMPTNWISQVGGTGLTQTIVGTGTESGIPYVDIRYAGTTIGTGFFPSFEANNNIAALTGQTWTQSVYFRLVGGSLTNVTGLNLGWQELTSAPAFINSHGSSTITPTAAALVSQRNTFSFTNTGGATTAFVYPTFGVLYANGVAIDLTIRIGAPQMELGAIATSPILPAIGTPAATTRAADNATMATGAWFNATAGTLVADVMEPNVAPAASQQYQFQFDDGSDSNRILARNFSGGGTLIGNAIVATATTATTASAATYSARGAYRLGLSYGAGVVNIAANGGAVQSASGALPTSFTTLRLGNTFAGASALNGYIGRLQYWTRVLSSPEIILATTMPGSSLDINFQNGVDARVSTTRAAGGATYYDKIGTLQLASANTQRIDYGPTQFVTNTIRNSSMVGVAAGTPGTLPTNWTIGGNLLTFGITQTIVGSGTENGFPYVDIQLSGTTNTASGFVSFFFEALTQIPALSGQTWTASAGIRLVGGSFANISSMTLNVNGRVLAGGNNEAFAVAIVPTAAALTAQNRFTQVGTFISGTTVWATSSYTFNVASSGVAINATLRIAAPQLESGAVANPWVPTTTVATTVPVPAAGVTNYAENNQMVGAAIGTGPTAWGFGTVSGIAVAITGVGTEGGINYIDVRFFGTPATTGSLTRINPAISAKIPVAPSHLLTSSFYMRLMAGVLPTNACLIEVAEFTAANVFFGNVTVPINPTNAALATQRFSATLTIDLTGGLATYDIPFTLTSGVAVDFTVRVGGTQLERGAFPTALIPTFTAGAVNAGAIPLGLLSEEARTNGIRNPRAEGSTVGAIGSGGVAPTNWAVSSSGTTGVVTSIVGSGSENGVPYLDVSFVGTNSSGSTGFPSINFETNTIAAVTGQTWAYSLNARLLTGTSPNLVFAISETATAGGFLAQHNVVTGAVTTAPLSSQRLAGTFTLNQATCAWVGCFINFSIANGASVNCTLRIGAPQLELSTGAFASSPILPAVGTPAATTRALDVNSLPAGIWYNANQGSLEAEWMFEGRNGTGLFATPAAFVASDPDNEFILCEQATGAIGSPTILGGAVKTGGVATITGQGNPVVLPSIVQKGVTSWVVGAKVNSAHNGTLGTASPSNLAATPNILSLIIAGHTGFQNPMSQWVRRVRYWPRALAAAEMQAVTT